MTEIAINMTLFWFKIWDDNNGEEPDTPNAYGSDMESIALEFGERNFSRSDYPTMQTIMVRHPTGALYVFDVEAEQVVVFRAKVRP